jgi:hypothetical protein
MSGFVLSYVPPGGAGPGTPTKAERGSLEDAAVLAWHLIWPERGGSGYSIARGDGGEVMSEAELRKFAAEVARRDGRTPNDVHRHARDILREMGKL